MGELAELAGCGGAESLEVAIIVLGTGEEVISKGRWNCERKSERIYRIFVGGRLTCIFEIYYVRSIFFDGFDGAGDTSLQTRREMFSDPLKRYAVVILVPLKYRYVRAVRSKNCANANGTCSER